METRAKIYFEELVQTGSRKKKKMTDGIHLKISCFLSRQWGVLYFYHLLFTAIQPF
jgi:hypothetical protein